MSLKLKKVVGLGAAIVLVAAWFASGILENSYVNYPKVPNRQEGKTTPHAVKGVVVYITERQQLFLSWLMWTEFGSAIVAALVILIHRGDPFKIKK